MQILSWAKMKVKKLKDVFAIIFIIMLCAFFLSGCSTEQSICYYGYFEDTAYAFVYTYQTNSFYCIRLPLEQILLWGKESGLNSIPAAMGNFVGLREKGFLLGSSDTLNTLKDLLDTLGSESDESASREKRVRTLAEKASVLSKKPLSDKINQLCGPDSEKLLKLLAESKPKCRCYDARSFLTTDDLNFSQRYFTQWLEQVLGGNA